MGVNPSMNQNRPIEVKKKEAGDDYNKSRKPINSHMGPVATKSTRAVRNNSLGRTSPNMNHHGGHTDTSLKDKTNLTTDKSTGDLKKT